MKITLVKPLPKILSAKRTGTYGALGSAAPVRFAPSHVTVCRPQPWHRHALG
ncbi:MAG: hypothetical protein QM744_01310 [Mesorhizobium sp.]